VALVLAVLVIILVIGRSVKGKKLEEDASVEDSPEVIESSSME
jgi:hypothetical protein